MPCAIADDVTIKINWHELRILTMWAHNFAAIRALDSDAKRGLAAIIVRLEKQFPDKTPLTLAGEVRQLQEDYPSAELVVDGEVIVPRKKVQ